jgi:hypothetical protein
MALIVMSNVCHWYLVTLRTIIAAMVVQELATLHQGQSYEWL